MAAPPGVSTPAALLTYKQSEDMDQPWTESQILNTLEVMHTVKTLVNSNIP